MSDSLERSLGRVEGKIDLMLANMATRAEDDNDRFGDIGKRLSVIEGWRAQVLGAAVVVGALGGLLVTLVFK